MNTAVFRALICADSRLLWRDPLLGWILALPIGLALLLRPLIPRVQEGLLAGAGFDFGRAARDRSRAATELASLASAPAAGTAVVSGSRTGNASKLGRTTDAADAVGAAAGN